MIQTKELQSQGLVDGQEMQGVWIAECNQAIVQRGSPEGRETQIGDGDKSLYLLAKEVHGLQVEAERPPVAGLLEQSVSKDLTNCSGKELVFC